MSNTNTETINDELKLTKQEAKILRRLVHLQPMGRIERFLQRPLRGWRGTLLVIVVVLMLTAALYGVYLIPIKFSLLIGPAILLVLAIAFIAQEPVRDRVICKLYSALKKERDVDEEGRSETRDGVQSEKKEFHFKEYESLKKEVSEQVEHTRKLEIYAAGSIAAFYSWFISAKTDLPRELFIIPVLLAILGAWRSRAALTRIDEIAVYLVQLESVFALSGLGWELHRKHNPSRPFLLSGAVFWGALVLVTAAAWLVLRFCWP